MLYAKTAFGLTTLLVAWTYLVFAAHSPLGVGGAGLAFLFGAMIVAVCLLHDANHGTFFRSRSANYRLAWLADALLGFGSYSWRVKHNLAHHTYPNVDGYDDDIAQTPLARLAPSQEPQWWYRWQRFYIWPLYSLNLLRWHVTDVFTLKAGAITSTALRPPRGWDLIGLVGGKVVFVSWALLIPMQTHSWWNVVGVFIGLNLIGSFFMVVIFQLSHCVEEAAFFDPSRITSSRQYWAVNEVESTVDFCPRNRFLTWCVGSLNFQIEHHLFPAMPHTIYPVIASTVREQAEMHGVRYTVQPTLRFAVASHYRHLREMGRRGEAVEIEMG